VLNFLFFIIRYFTGLGIEDNKRAVIQILGDKMTALLTESIKMSSSKDKAEKFESFIKQLDTFKLLINYLKLCCKFSKKIESH